MTPDRVVPLPVDITPEQAARQLAAIAADLEKLRTSVAVGERQKYMRLTAQVQMLSVQVKRYWAAPRSEPARAPQRKPRAQGKSWDAKNNLEEGTRFCPRHNDGKGAWLPFDQFDRKSPASTKIRFCCRDCWKDYQHGRYLKVTQQAITIEVMEGDDIIGTTCKSCGQKFEAHDYVAAGHVRHDHCLAEEVAS